MGESHTYITPQDRKWESGFGIGEILTLKNKMGNREGKKRRKVD